MKKISFSLYHQTFPKPTLKIGLGGNYYVICDDKESLGKICALINKSKNSIYFNKKYECYAIRIKSRDHKIAIRSNINALVV